MKKYLKENSQTIVVLSGIAALMVLGWFAYPVRLRIGLYNTVLTNSEIIQRDWFLLMIPTLLSPVFIKLMFFTNSKKQFGRIVKANYSFNEKAGA